MRGNFIAVIVLLISFASPQPAHAGKVPLKQILKAADFFFCKAMGEVTKQEALTIFTRERKKYPKGQPVVLHFFVDGYRSADKRSGPKCLTRFEPKGRTLGSGTDFMFPALPRGTMVSFPTTGLGESIPKSKEVKITIDPTARSVKACQAAGFQAKVTYDIDGETHSFDATGLKVHWSSSDPEGLALLSGTKSPGSIGAAGGGFVQFFQGRREGTYSVTVSLGRVSTGDVVAAALAGNPIAAQQLAEELARTTATATVTVGKPTVKHIGVFPKYKELAVGEKVPFQAHAAFEEACVKPRDVTKEATWVPAGSNIYVAPERKPASLTVTSESHPNLQAQACETATFKASLNFEPAEVPIEANWGGGKGNGKVKITPPDPRVATHDPSVTWTTPPGGPSFQIDTTEPITVEATHPDAGSDSRVLQVKDPTLQRVSVQPPNVNLKVGQQKTFVAYAHYEQACLTPDPLGPGDGLTWSAGNNGTIANDGTYEAKRPGSDTIVASLGDKPPGQASVTIPTPKLIIDPPADTLTLDQERAFRAVLANYKDVTFEQENLQWAPFGANVFKKEVCGTFPMTATYTDPETKQVQSATALVTVNVSEGECLAIRERLAASLSPEHVEESKQWLAKRDALEAKGCHCTAEPGLFTGEDEGGEPTWTAEDEGTESTPTGGSECIPPSLMGGKLKLRYGDLPTCGAVSVSDEPQNTCLPGMIPGYDQQGQPFCFCPAKKPHWVPGGDGQGRCVATEDLVASVSCPAGSNKVLNRYTGQVLCASCPSGAAPSFDANNQLRCVTQGEPGMSPAAAAAIGSAIIGGIINSRTRGRPRQPSARPRKPRGKKCHRRPDGKGWHCKPG